MYNLLVSGSDESWQGNAFELEPARVAREFTEDNLKARFAKLDIAAIAELKKIPAIFAYEHFLKKPAHLGRITKIQSRPGTVRFEYEIEKTLPEISPETLIKLQWDLDLSEWEMNRTHWAVKDVDLNKVLIAAGFLKGPYEPPELKSSFGEKLLAAKRAAADQSPAVYSVKPTVFQIPEAQTDADLVAVMMPFTKDFDAVHEAIQNACKAAGLRSERADQTWVASEIIQDIFSLIYRSRFVICDFTGANTNVFYETGIAHTLGRVVVPISQNHADVPFDLQHHRYIPYVNNGEGLSGLAQDIEKRLQTLRKQ